MVKRLTDECGKRRLLLGPIAVLSLLAILISPFRAFGLFGGGLAEKSGALSARDKETSKAVEEVIDNMNKARDTGDTRCYDRAEAVLGKAFKADPKSYEALRLKGWLEAGRHRFEQALVSAEKASAIRPSDSWNYGIKVDALVELGRYAEAVREAQRMVDLKPSTGAYSRIAYLRWLYGDPEGAVEMWRMAVDAAPAGGSDAAWCKTRLGDELFNCGRLQEADATYREVLADRPGFGQAFAGLGRVHAARRHYDEAIASYTAAISAAPRREYRVALGDVYELKGDADRARQQFDLVDKIDEATAANPETGLQRAIFYAEHDREADLAVALAEADARQSSDIQACDALAWAYYKAERISDAKTAIKKAVRLKTRDARLLFHQGMIEAAAGESEEGYRHLQQALSINPYFDPNDAATARTSLKEIERRREEGAVPTPHLLILLAAVGPVLGFAAARLLGRRSPRWRHR